MKVRWTDCQIQAIEKTDSDVIVAASAGSGKTSTMIARALSLIIKGVSVERILMLTYGEAAAAEMREKLRKELINYAKTTTTNKEHIIKQLDNLSRADISTIHSFCKSIVKSNFEIAEVNPTFEIADDKTAKILAQKAMTNLLKAETERATPQFVEIRDMLSPRDDRALIEIISKIHEHMTSQADRHKWLEETFDNEYKVELENTSAVKYLVNYLREKAALITKRTTDLQNSAKSLGEEFYCSFFAGLYDRIAGYANCMGLKDYFREQERQQISKKVTRITSKNESSTLYPTAINLRNEIGAYEKEVTEALGEAEYSQTAKILEKNALQVAELIRLVKEFDKEYSHHKIENNLLDFSDLEKYALIVLEDREKREEIRANYDYVFVDEYQDTNYVQEKIISMVTASDRLFVVGDSKQCIYRFRLAEPTIFIEKFKKFKQENKAISFNDNFRSDSQILSFVNDVFSELMHENIGGINYARDAAFNIKNEDKEKVNPIAPVEICSVTPYAKKEKSQVRGIYSVKDTNNYVQDRQESAEGRVIATKIMDLVGREYIGTGDSKRLIDYSDIIIMFRNRSNAKGIIDELVNCEIPLRLGQFSVSSQEDDISLLINYLKFLNNRKDDYTLLAVLRSPFASFSNSELAEIRKKARDKQFFYQAAEECANGADELGEKLKAVYALADKFEFESQYTNVAPLLRKIVYESGLYDYICSGVDGKDRLVVLEYFFSSIEGKAYTRSITAFVEYYNENKDKLNYGDSAVQLASGVNISTIHASKGLEYPIVILAGTANSVSNFKRGNILVDNSLGIGINFYDSLTRTVSPSIVLNAIALKKQQEELEDALRLFYVALTRAKYHLIVTAETGTVRYQSYYNWLMQVAQKNPRVQDLVTQYNFDQVSEVSAKVEPVFFTKPNKQLQEKFCKAYSYEYPYKIATQESIKYTVTGINKEEEIVVPSLFEEEKVKQGIDYHKIMQYIDYKEHTFEGVQKELSRLKEEGIIEKDDLDSIDINQISNCLSTDIMRYAAQNKCYKEKRFMMSLPLNELKEAGTGDKVIIQGTIDLLIVGEKVVIVDFKYSNLNADILRNKYKRQLEIYKQAVEEAMNIKVDQLIIYAFGSNSVIEV